MTMRGQGEREKLENGTWVEWAYRSWTGRGLLAMMVIMLGLVFVFARDHMQVEMYLKARQASGDRTVLVDAVEKSVRSLVRSLACGLSAEGTDSPRHPPAIADLRRIVTELVHDSGTGVAPDAKHLLAALESVSAKIDAGAFTGSRAGERENQQALDGVDYQWLVLKRALRERESAGLAVEIRRTRQILQQRYDWLIAAGILSLFVLVTTLGLSWKGEEKLRGQVERITAGASGEQITLRRWEGHRALTGDLNRLSAKLHHCQESSRENDLRQEMALRHLNLALESALAGDFERSFHPQAAGIWQTIASSVSSLIDRLRLSVAAREEERAALAGTVAVSRDSLV